VVAFALTASHEFTLEQAKSIF